MTRAIYLAVAICGGCSGPSAPPNETLPSAVTTTTAEIEVTKPVALEKLLVEGIPNWIIVLSEAPDKAARPTVDHSIPLAVREKFDALLAAVEALARTTDAATDSSGVENAAAELNNALTDSKLAYAIDVVVIDAHGPAQAPTVLLFSFALERVRLYATKGDASHRVRWARRIDPLAFRYRYLGFTSRGSTPLVLLGSIDELICSQLFGTSPAVGNAARANAVRLAGSPAAELFESLRGRLELFERWNQTLASRGASMRVPTTRLLATGWRKHLSGAVDDAELARLAKIEKTLGSPEVVAAYQTLHNQLAVAIELHELQHALDLETAIEGTFVLPGAGQQRRHIEHEVSAVLAELARSPSTSHLSLARLSALATAPRTSIEQIATRTALSLVAGDPDRLGKNEIVGVVNTLAALDGEVIAQKARDAWKRGFGRPLPALRFVREAKR